MRQRLSKLTSICAISVCSAGIAFIPALQPSLAQTCNVFGCSQPGAGECNPFGCPNPGAGACTPFGCPPSPKKADQQSPPVVIVRPDGNSSIGDCMDRLMYRDIRAISGPNENGDYRFRRPQGVTDSAMEVAGLREYYYKEGVWYGAQPVAKVQVMDGRTAAASCR